MSDNQLKPCPFCGVRAELHTHNIEPPVYGVSCDNAECGISMIGDNREHAIQKWNTRPSLTEAEARKVCDEFLLMKSAGRSHGWATIKTEDVYELAELLMHHSRPDRLEKVRDGIREELRRIESPTFLWSCQEEEKGQYEAMARGIRFVLSLIDEAQSQTTKG